ncbi:MAG: PA2779 family protein [Terriglobia bacterium]
MRLLKRQSVIVFLALIAASLLTTPLLSAADHVVSPAQLHQALTSVAAARQNNLAQVEKFFSSPSAKRALERGGLSLQQVEKAVPTLSNQQLAELSQRTRKIQSDFAAGALSNERLTYIVIALATALIIILIFEA